MLQQSKNKNPNIIILVSPMSPSGEKTCGRARFKKYTLLKLFWSFCQLLWVVSTSRLTDCSEQALWWQGPLEPANLAFKVGWPLSSGFKFIRAARDDPLSTRRFCHSAAVPARKVMGLFFYFHFKVRITVLKARVSHSQGHLVQTCMLADTIYMCICVRKKMDSNCEDLKMGPSLTFSYR